MQKLKKKIAKKPTPSGAEPKAPSGQPPAPSEKKLTPEEVDQLRVQEIQGLNNNGYFRYNQLLQMEVQTSQLAQINESLQKLGEVVEDLVEQIKEGNSAEVEEPDGEEPAEETEEKPDGEEPAAE